MPRKLGKKSAQESKKVHFRLTGFVQKRFYLSSLLSSLANVLGDPTPISKIVFD